MCSGKIVSRPFRNVTHFFPHEIPKKLLYISRFTTYYNFTDKTKTHGFFCKSRIHSCVVSIGACTHSGSRLSIYAAISNHQTAKCFDDEKRHES